MRPADIPVGEEAPRIVDAVVEAPIGSSDQYEYNPAVNSFMFDRVRYPPLYCPTDDDWIPGRCPSTATRGLSRMPTRR